MRLLLLTPRDLNRRDANLLQSFSDLGMKNAPRAKIFGGGLIMVDLLEIPRNYCCVVLFLMVWMIAVV